MKNALIDVKRQSETNGAAVISDVDNFYTKENINDFSASHGVRRQTLTKSIQWGVFGSEAGHGGPCSFLYIITSTDLELSPQRWSRAPLECS